MLSILSIVSVRYDKNRLVGKKVGKEFHFTTTMTGKRNAFDQSGFQLAQYEIFKTGNRHIIDGGLFRFIVPGIGQRGVRRHVSFEHQLQSAAPISKVREADDGMASDAEHLAENGLGFLDDLEGLTQNDIIIGFVGEDVQAGIQVILEDTDASFGTLEDILLTESDAQAVNIFLFFETSEQFAVATAQVQNRAIGFNEVLDLSMIHSLACKNAAFGLESLIPDRFRYFPFG